MVSTKPDVTAPHPNDEEHTDGTLRTYQPMSRRGPALIVLGIAVLIVVVGLVASSLDTGGTPSPAVHSVTIPDGTTVHLTAATSAMHSIVSAGEPPEDILGNMAVPEGSLVEGTVDRDQNQGQFDRTVKFSTGLSSDQVIDVYRTLLPRLGWHVTYVGTDRQGQGTELLAKRGSGDGFYWEVGAVVLPTTSTGTTPFSLELFELNDDN